MQELVYVGGMPQFTLSFKSILSISFLALVPSFVSAQDSDSSAVAEPLSEADRSAAIRMDDLTIPTPGEFFAAIDKQGQPSWPSQYREPIPVTFTSRPQIALNLGGLLTDGFIAVAARDGQRVKNTGKDIIALAKALGVSENVIARGNIITDFAENDQWQALEEELEATQNEVKLAMIAQKDDALVILVSLGAWIRGVEVVSGLVEVKYDPKVAELLRQPALVGYLRGKLALLPERLKSDPLIGAVDAGVQEIETLVSFPIGEAPSEENVKKLHEVSAKLIAKIVAK